MNELITIEYNKQRIPTGQTLDSREVAKGMTICCAT